MFGTDFSNIKIHEDHRATLVGAAAYSDRDSIYFAPGAFLPNTESGKQLLAHELGHTVQQSAARVQDVATGLVQVSGPEE